MCDTHCPDCRAATLAIYVLIHTVCWARLQKRNTYNTYTHQKPHRNTHNTNTHISDIDRCRSVLNDIDRCISVLSDIDRCRPSLSDIDRCRPILSDIVRCRRILSDIYRCIPIFSDIDGCIRALNVYTRDLAAILAQQICDVALRSKAKP